MRRKQMLFVILVITSALASGPAVAQQGKKKPQSRAGKEMTANRVQESEVPFACSLTALSASERQRHRELSEKLHASVKEVRELRDGYGFRLGGEREAIILAAEWISLERLCCPFFGFQLEVGSEATPTWLRITGREGVKEFMRVEFGIK